MNEGGEQILSPAIPDEQRLAVAAHSDLRRRSQDISVRLNTLLHSTTFNDVPITLKPVYEDEHLEVLHSLQGEVSSQDTDIRELTPNINSYLEKASKSRNLLPNQAALQFAKAAALQQASGVSYEDSLNQAKRCLEECREQGIPYSRPADFLPDAIIIGIERRAAEVAILPTSAEVAQAVPTTPGLLKDYALVLPEEERPRFVGAFPDEEQPLVSLELDAAVSTALDSEVITDPQDIAQRNNVRERVTEAFAAALQSLGKPRGKNYILSDELGSPWSSKQITQTLSRLGGNDSVRLIKDISETTTDQLKALNKQLKKKSPAERAKGLRPFISFTARVLDTLIETDTKRGGVLASRFLEMTALPDRLFTHFSRKLVDKDYFSQNFPAFLSTENIPVLKRIIAKYGSQFNTIVDTLSQIPAYKNHDLVPHEAEIMEALADLGTLTPRIFEKYRQRDPVERKLFADTIRKLKPRFFHNEAIKGILAPRDQDILTEMVYMAYKPMGMSFEKVEALIKQLDDQVEDMAQYDFPKEGYPMTFEKKGQYIVKDHERVDMNALRQYRDLLTPTRYEGQTRTTSTFAQATQSLFTEASQATGEEMREGLQGTAALQTLLAPLAQEARVQDFLQRSGQLTTENAYQAGSELAEIMGVYFRDNYQQLLANYFTTHDDEFRQVMDLLKTQPIQAAINEHMERSGSTMNWQALDTMVEASVRSRLQRLTGRQASTEAQKYVATLFTKVLQQEYVMPMEKQIRGELSKFMPVATETTYISRGALKAYISKNVGSFFAKAAAGICTAEDIPLFERDDHFHINVVENEETVRANIQAYVTKVNGKQSLVLRGFNPTADWVGKIDIESFCEQILAIGKQFQQANGLAGVYITEQGGWHALSNREQVAQYLMGRYINNQQGVATSLEVATDHSVSKIYLANS